MVLRPPTPPKFHPCQGAHRVTSPALLVAPGRGSWHDVRMNRIKTFVTFWLRTSISMPPASLEAAPKSASLGRILRQNICLRWQEKENPLLNGSSPSKERKKNIESPYQTKRIRCLFHFGKITVFHFFPSASFCHFSTIDCKQSLHYGQLQSCLSLCCLGKLKFCLLFVCSYCRECYSDFIICGIWSTSVEVSSVDYCLRLCP